MTDCACVWVGDYDGPDFYRIDHHVAKKKWNCKECGRIIHPGEKYQYEVGSWDGDFEQVRTCVDCESVADAFFCDGVRYSRMWEDLADHLCECGGDICPIVLDDLTPRARVEVVNLIDSYLED